MTTNRTRRARVDYPEGDSAGERQWVGRGGSPERRRERKSGLSGVDAEEGFARQQERGKMGEPRAMVDGGGDLWRGMGCRQGWVERGSGGNGVEKLEVRGGATKMGDNVTTIWRWWRRRQPEAEAA